MAEISHFFMIVRTVEYFAKRYREDRPGFVAILCKNEKDRQDLRKKFHKRGWYLYNGGIHMEISKYCFSLGIYLENNTFYGRGVVIVYSGEIEPRDGLTIIHPNNQKEIPI